MCDALTEVMAKSVKKHGSFNYLGLLKLTLVKKPAVSGGKLVKNPFTGEMVKQKARPASRSVRVRPMKAIKDMLDGGRIRRRRRTMNSPWIPGAFASPDLSESGKTSGARDICRKNSQDWNASYWRRHGRSKRLGDRGVGDGLRERPSVREVAGRAALRAGRGSGPPVRCARRGSRPCAAASRR